VIADQFPEHNDRFCRQGGRDGLSRLGAIGVYSVIRRVRSTCDHLSPVTLAHRSPVSRLNRMTGTKCFSSPIISRRCLLDPGQSMRGIVSSLVCPTHFKQHEHRQFLAHEGDLHVPSGFAKNWRRMMPSAPALALRSQWRVTDAAHQLPHWHTPVRWPHILSPPALTRGRRQNVRSSG